MGNLVLQTAPAAEPVTYAEAKTHLRLETDDDQAYVATLIKVARRHIEAVAWRALVTQTWDLYLDEFPEGAELELAKGSLQSVTSITYTDEAGAPQTLSSSAYQVDTKRVHGRVVLAPDASWPSTRDVINAVCVRFVAGYGDASAVPDDLKHAVLMIVSHLYENRESEITGTIISKFGLAVDSLVAPHRAVRF